VRSRSCWVDGWGSSRGMAVKAQVNVEKELSVHGARVLVCKGVFG